MNFLLEQLEKEIEESLESSLRDILGGNQEVAESVRNLMFVLEDILKRGLVKQGDRDPAHHQSSSSHDQDQQQDSSALAHLFYAFLAVNQHSSPSSIRCTPTSPSPRARAEWPACPARVR